MIRYYPIYLSFLVFILGCNSCNDDCFDMTDPDCVNYNFCSTLENLDAGFEVFTFRESSPFEDGEIIRTENPIIDTTYPGRLYFRALSDDAANFDWDLVADPRFINAKEWDLFFPASTGNVEVRLAVERDNMQCPDRDLETSSSSRTLFILPNKTDFPVPYIAKYVGNNQSEPDSLDFEIEFFVSIPEEAKIEIRNFPRNALNRGDLDNLGIVSNYKSFIISPTANICCSRAFGAGVFSDDRRELRIEYSTYNFDLQEWKEDVWTGTRVE